MKRLFALLFAALAFLATVPLPAPVLAQTSVAPLAALGGVRFNGPGDPAASTEATFGVGMSNNGGRTFTTTAGAGEGVSIYGMIVPPAAHRGRPADVFVVNRINGVFMMKNLDGQFVPWNTVVPDLVPAFEDVMLTATTQVQIFSGVIGIAGDHQIFLGYMIDGQLHYTPIPHVLAINGFNDLKLASTTTTAVLPNISGRSVDETKVYGIAHGVKGPGTTTLLLTNTGNLPLEITAVSLEGAPAGVSVSLDDFSLEPGASARVALRFEANSETYAQLSILNFRTPGKRYFLNFADNSGKTYRYALEYWFLHYGTYDITRTVSSPTRGCTLPRKSFSTTVTGYPLAGTYHIKMNNFEIPRTAYQPDGSVTFNRDISYGEAEGIVYESLTVRIDATGRLTGTSTWTWSDFDDECKGTANYSGQIR